jgi:hypothetical protein
LKISFIAFCISLSDLLSRDEVASSNTIIPVCLAKTLAIHILCFSHQDNLTPLSQITVFSLLGNSFTNISECDIFNTKSSSFFFSFFVQLKSSNIFSSILVLNNSVSCSTTDIFFNNSFLLILLIFILFFLLENNIFQPVGATCFISNFIKVDFQEPDFPTNAIFSQFFILKLKFLITNLLLYEKLKLFISI